jgi:hypothetical protein
VQAAPLAATPPFVLYFVLFVFIAVLASVRQIQARYAIYDPMSRSVLKSLRICAQRMRMLYSNARDLPRPFHSRSSSSRPVDQTLQMGPADESCSKYEDMPMFNFSCSPICTRKSPSPLEPARSHMRARRKLNS